jgi:hypothetical protein
MKSNDKLVEELIKNITENPADWVFTGEYAINSKAGIRVWLTNIPLLGFRITLPTEVTFGLFDRIRIWNSFKKCRNLYIIKLLNKKT